MTQRGTTERAKGTSSIRLVPSATAATLRVLVVDPHRLVADAISTTLYAHGAVAVDVATNAKDALSCLRSAAPDLVLLDCHLADAHSVALGRRIMAEAPDTRIVFVAASSDPSTVTEGIRAGFHGYVTKDTTLSQLLSTIEAALADQVVIPHPLARAAAGGRGAEGSDAALLARQLTDRERDVLDLLVQGSSGDEIGRLLTISRNTVRTHVQNILNKLQVHSRLEAVSFAIRHRLVDVPAERRDLSDAREATGPRPARTP